MSCFFFFNFFVLNVVVEYEMLRECCSGIESLAIGWLVNISIVISKLSTSAAVITLDLLLSERFFCSLQGRTI